MRPRIVTPVTLNDSTWARIRINFPVETLVLQCRTAVAVMIALNPVPGEDYWTIKSGSSLMLDFSGWKPQGFMYGKSSSGEVKLEIITLV